MYFNGEYERSCITSLAPGLDQFIQFQELRINYNISMYQMEVFNTMNQNYFKELFSDVYDELKKMRRGGGPLKQRLQQIL